MWCGRFNRPRGAIALLAGICGIAPALWAGETQRTPVMRRTQLIIKLATAETLPVQSRFEPAPPTIVLDFPPEQVTGALPDRSVIRQGVVEEIHTSYGSSESPSQARWIKDMRIQLRGPYEYTVQAEAGRIIVMIAHPADVTSEAIEVGLTGGVVVSGAAAPVLSERFQAMQEALLRARPQPWTVKMDLFSDGGRLAPQQAALPAPSSPAVPARPLRPAPRPSRSADWPWFLGYFFGAVGGLAGTAWALKLWRRGGRPSAPAAPRVPTGMRIIDQLVWRSFERQGYQLIQLTELDEPLGLMRLVARDGLKAAVVCVGDGTFFERTTVEQCLRVMRAAQIDRGFLIAPGAFTIPAQRYAKEHGLTLLGRDQLTELVSDGAMTEHYTKQLQQLHVQVSEAKETLTQYVHQFEDIRRQRNEASWLLGEERAKSATLEAGVEELTQQLRESEAQAEQWRQAAGLAKQQWEESQWYLGEAHASAEHLDGQLRSVREAQAQFEEQAREFSAQLRECSAQLAEVERQRDEANWFLGEARAELAAIQSHGERRRAARLHRSDLTLELATPDGAAVFRGTPRDISLTGFGMDIEHALDALPEPLRVRLYLAGLPDPLETTGRVVWSRRVGENGRHVAGCTFVDMPEESREAFERVLTG